MEAGSGGPNPETDHAGSIRWKPNEECLQMLLGMGIDRNSAIKGLYYTGNTSAEFAAAYVFDNPDLDDELDASLRVESRDSRADDDGLPHFKMVLVVNTSLGMSLGKTAGQVAHATLGLYRQMVHDRMRYSNYLIMWEEEGEKKIVVRGEDGAQLIHLDKQGASLDVATYLVKDAGRTEVPPDSVTVLAVFGREEEVDVLTGKLQLL